ncbi:unnamed protein product [Symbiodinium sp. CCMP2592]|nr:unnamed protein product [Symbiodinium sp. CCMP2592]
MPLPRFQPDLVYHDASMHLRLQQGFVTGLEGDFLPIVSGYGTLHHDLEVNVCLWAPEHFEEFRVPGSMSRHRLRETLTEKARSWGRGQVVPAATSPHALAVHFVAVTTESGYRTTLFASDTSCICIDVPREAPQDFLLRQCEAKLRSDCVRFLPMATPLRHGDVIRVELDKEFGRADASRFLLYSELARPSRWLDVLPYRQLAVLTVHRGVQILHDTVTGRSPHSAVQAWLRERNHVPRQAVEVPELSNMVGFPCFQTIVAGATNAVLWLHDHFGNPNTGLALAAVGSFSVAVDVLEACARTSTSARAVCSLVSTADLRTVHTVHGLCAKGTGTKTLFVRMAFDLQALPGDSISVHRQRATVLRTRTPTGLAGSGRSPASRQGAAATRDADGDLRVIRCEADDVSWDAVVSLSGLTPWDAADLVVTTEDKVAGGLSVTYLVASSFDQSYGFPVLDIGVSGAQVVSTGIRPGRQLGLVAMWLLDVEVWTGNSMQQAVQIPQVRVYTAIRIWIVDHPSSIQLSGPPWPTEEEIHGIVQLGGFGVERGTLISIRGAADPAVYDAAYVLLHFGHSGMAACFVQLDGRAAVFAFDVQYFDWAAFGRWVADVFRAPRELVQVVTAGGHSASPLALVHSSQLSLLALRAPLPVGPARRWSHNGMLLSKRRMSQRPKVCPLQRFPYCKVEAEMAHSAARTWVMPLAFLLPIWGAPTLEAKCLVGLPASIGMRIRQAALANDFLQDHALLRGWPALVPVRPQPDCGALHMIPRAVDPLRANVILRGDDERLWAVSFPSHLTVDDVQHLTLEGSRISLRTPQEAGSTTATAAMNLRDGDCVRFAYAGPPRPEPASDGSYTSRSTGRMPLFWLTLFSPGLGRMRWVLLCWLCTGAFAMFEPRSTGPVFVPFFPDYVRQGLHTNLVRVGRFPWRAHFDEANLLMLVEGRQCQVACLSPFWGAGKAVIVDAEASCTHSFSRADKDRILWADGYAPVWPAPVAVELTVVPTPPDPTTVCIVARVWHATVALLTPRVVTVEWLLRALSKQGKQLRSGDYILAIPEMVTGPGTTATDDESFLRHAVPWSLPFRILAPVRVRLWRPGDKIPQQVSVEAGSTWDPDLLTFSSFPLSHLAGSWVPVPWVNDEVPNLVVCASAHQDTAIVLHESEGGCSCVCLDNPCTEESLATALSAAPSTLRIVGGVLRASRPFTLRDGDIVLSASHTPRTSEENIADAHPASSASGVSHSQALSRAFLVAILSVLSDNPLIRLGSLLSILSASQAMDTVADDTCSQPASGSRDRSRSPVSAQLRDLPVHEAGRVHAIPLIAQLAGPSPDSCPIQVWCPFAGVTAAVSVRIEAFWQQIEAIALQHSPTVIVDGLGTTFAVLLPTVITLDALKTAMTVRVGVPVRIDVPLPCLILGAIDSNLYLRNGDRLSIALASAHPLRQPAAWPWFRDWQEAGQEAVWHNTFLVVHSGVVVLWSPDTTATAVTIPAGSHWDPRGMTIRSPGGRALNGRWVPMPVRPSRKPWLLRRSADKLRRTVLLSGDTPVCRHLHQAEAAAYLEEGAYVVSAGVNDKLPDLPDPELRDGDWLAVDEDAASDAPPAWNGTISRFARPPASFPDWNNLGRGYGLYDDRKFFFSAAAGGQRRAFLGKQAQALSLDVLCLQECRSNAGRYVAGPYLTWRSGHEKGQYGVEIWVHQGAFGGDLQLQDWRIVASSPRYLAIRCQRPAFPVVIISAHAPHADRPQQDIVDFWTTSLRHPLLGAACIKGKLGVIRATSSQCLPEFDIINSTLDHVPISCGLQICAETVANAQDRRRRPIPPDSVATAIASRVWENFSYPGDPERATSALTKRFHRFAKAEQRPDRVVPRQPYISDEAITVLTALKERRRQLRSHARVCSRNLMHLAFRIWSTPDRPRGHVRQCVRNGHRAYARTWLAVLRMKEHAHWLARRDKAAHFQQLTQSATDFWLDTGRAMEATHRLRWASKRAAERRKVFAAGGHDIDADLLRQFQQQEDGQRLTAQELQAELRKASESSCRPCSGALPSLLDVEHQCRRQKLRKAPGPDRISNGLWKGQPVAAAQWLWMLCADIAGRGKEPPQFKAALVQCRRRVHTGFAVASFRSLVALSDFAGRSWFALFLDVQAAYYEADRQLLFGQDHGRARQREASRLVSGLLADGVLRHRGMAEDVCALLEDCVRCSHWSLCGHDAIILAGRGSRPGDGLADVLFGAIFAQILDDVEAQLVSLQIGHRSASEAVGGPCRPIQIAWADDLSVLVDADSATQLADEALDVLVPAATPQVATILCRARLAVQIATTAPAAVLDLVEASCERDLPWTSLLKDAVCTVGTFAGLSPDQLRDSPMRIARAHDRLLRGACRRFGRFGSGLLAFHRLWRSRAIRAQTGTIGQSNPVQCPMCGWIGRTAQALAAHRHRKHGTLARATELCNGTTCSWCLRDFHSSDRLKYHIVTSAGCRLPLEISVGAHHQYGSGTKRRGPQQHRRLPPIQLCGPRNATPAERLALDNDQPWDAAALLVEWEEAQASLEAEEPPHTVAAESEAATAPCLPASASALAIAQLAGRSFFFQDQGLAPSPLWSGLRRGAAGWWLPHIWQNIARFWQAMADSAALSPSILTGYRAAIRSLADVRDVPAHCPVSGGISATGPELLLRHTLTFLHLARLVPLGHALCSAVPPSSCLRAALGCICPDAAWSLTVLQDHPVWIFASLGSSLSRLAFLFRHPPSPLAFAAPHQLSSS